MNKWIKYILLLAIIVFVAYNSVYTRKLSEVKNELKINEFNAAAYAANFLHQTLPANAEKALSLFILSRDLISNPDMAFALSHAQNNGNTRFFMVKGQGLVMNIDSEYVSLSITGVKQKVFLATKYIFGNAARDGSGLISVNEFTTTMDMNSVSEELNRLIRTEVLPPFNSKVKGISWVSFTGCIELQQNKAIPDTLELIPLILNIQ